MAKRKTTSAKVTFTYPDWMTAAQARREVRTLINNQSNYLSHGPDYQDVDEKTIRAIAVQPIARPHDG